ncbi:MAG: biotin--[acetyl-CoA-carboxylase] ligase [Bacteroidales bacterium]|jgi:BirA family biotin operon repressor/biotin-[acetyl-CoA-carboxylase] ligase|nr:biotin--[acetyl-CoA-carboxylase] ligase [Bacteroidales bacterium]
MNYQDLPVIRLKQTTSTNWHLLQLSNVENLAEGTVVVADSQTQGRGQGDSSWESKPGANLTFSIILYPKPVKASRQFILSKAISLAVYDFVSQFVPGASVKWPNDVYVDDKKITGMLIENFIEGAHITKTIAGIGVNINQERFVSDAPNPVSLRQLTGKTYRLEDCLQNLHIRITNRYRMITENTGQLNSDYLHHLYRFGQLSRYSANGLPFEATITGVNHYGMLEMTSIDGERNVFGFKEVVFE